MASPSLLLLLLSAAALGLFLPACTAENNILYTNEVLQVDQYISSDGKYVFKMQRDCDLVLSDNNRPIWNSGTSDRGSNCYVQLQDDGDLVIHTGSGRAIWRSNTGGEPRSAYVLVMQRDGNVVVYGPARGGTNTGSGAAKTVAGTVFGTKTSTSAAAKTSTGNGV